MFSDGGPMLGGIIASLLLALSFSAKFISSSAVCVSSDVVTPLSELLEKNLYERVRGGVGGREGGREGGKDSGGGEKE